jgi:hypothetical protein
MKAIKLKLMVLSFLIALSCISFAQELKISDEIKRKTILFLLEKKEISGTADNWRDNIDEISFRKIYSNKDQQEIIICSTLSAHGDYYILLCDKTATLFLNSQTLDKELTVILNYLSKSSTKNSGDKVVATLKEIVKVYEHNQMPGSRPGLK